MRSGLEEEFSLWARTLDENKLNLLREQSHHAARIAHVLKNRITSHDRREQMEFAQLSRTTSRSRQLHRQVGKHLQLMKMTNSFCGETCFLNSFQGQE